MTKPRAQVVVEGENVYHCISRCVRRAFLCGIDFQTGQSFDHRKEWIYDRLILLSKIFTIDVLAYALMSTHSHTMLRTRPDLLADLDDREIAIRWLKLYPHKKINPASKLFDELIDSMVNDKERIAKLRLRINSVSWFMKSLNEYIARKANKEDKCKGRFWQGRFDCQRLCDEAALLSCSIYIDLNPIRAGVAMTPEDSKYTGAYERIQALKKLQNINNINKEPLLWLSPIEDSSTKRGFLKISHLEYLRILDLSGRELREGKRGRIPDELKPILVRIGINPEYWLKTCDSCRSWFSSAIGSRQSLNKFAASHGKSWLKGMRISELAFY